MIEELKPFNDYLNRAANEKEVIIDVHSLELVRELKL